jgi:hypothetical protein
MLNLFAVSLIERENCQNNKFKAGKTNKKNQKKIIPIAMHFDALLGRIVLQVQILNCTA